MSTTVIGIGEVLWDIFPDQRRPGGAPANVAYHAGVLGNRGVVASRVGDDALGAELRDYLEGQGIDCSGLQVDDAHPTGTVQVHFDDGEPSYLITEDVAWDYLAMDEALEALAAETDAVCYSTLSQRSPGTRSTLRAFLDAVSPEALRILDVNLRPPHYDGDVLRHSIACANVVKCNEHEWNLLGTLVGTEEVDEWLLHDQDIQLVCLTRGADGSELMTPDDRLHLAAPEVDASEGDAVGVGDAFLAAITHHLLQDASLERMLTAANRYAAYVVTQRGGMPAVPQDVLDAVA
jgi:fructokinase